jgi:phosphatidylglycerophosphate synthase
MYGGRRAPVQRGSLTAVSACALVLVALDATVGLERTGWVVGLLCATGMGVVLHSALTHHRRRRLAPADAVTLTRAALACGLAALTASAFAGPVPTEALVGLAAGALVLDWVDGRVARRTGTASAFGAAFDMEVDAFLVLVLSVYVARSLGAWVLAIGAARYALLLAGLLVPWLRVPTPPRYWSKVVAATQAVVLAVAASGAIAPAAAEAAVAVALLLLAESFGHQVRWLRRNRLVAACPQPRDREPAA